MRHRLLAVLALVVAALCVTVTASAGNGHGHKGHHHARAHHAKAHYVKAHAKATAVYEFRGELLAVNSTSVQLRIAGGTHDALKALLGQSQDQTFAVDSSTKIVISGRAGTLAALKIGDEVVLRARADRGSSLADLEAQPAVAIADHTAPAPHTSGPLFLYIGTVSGPQATDHVTLHVESGNWRALQTMLGQSLDQSFKTDDGTIYLLWQGGKPTVIAPSELKAGDRITVRIHAPRDSSLSQVEAVPAAHVGDHEPGNPETEDND